MAFSSFQARRQHQFLRGLLLLTMALTLHFSPARANETVEDLCGDNHPHLMLVPILLSFESPGIREEYIYDALTPTLIIADQEYSPAIGTFDDRAGSKSYQFCVARSAYDFPLNKLKPDALSEAALQIGLSDVALTLDETSLDAWKKGDKNLNHAPILLTALPTPDWLILISAKLLQTDSEDQILEVVLLNPSTKGLLGPQLRADFARPSGLSCFEPGPTFRMDVKIKIDQASDFSTTKASVFATDPNYDEFTIRPAKFVSNECTGGDMLSFGLGSLPPVEGGHLVRYRWKIKVDAESDNQFDAVETQSFGQSMPLDLTHFSHTRVSLQGGRVWPRTLEFSAPR